MFTGLIPGGSLSSVPWPFSPWSIILLFFHPVQFLSGLEVGKT